MERRVEVRPITERPIERPTPYPPTILSPEAERLLQKIYDLLYEIYPAPQDYEANIGEVQTFYAGTITTITWFTRKEYKYYIKKVYVDAASDCSYKWVFPEVLTYDYKTSRVLYGNEHEFPKRLVVAPDSKIQLVVTNYGVSDVNLDIIVQMWARRV